MAKENEKSSKRDRESPALPGIASVAAQDLILLRPSRVRIDPDVQRRLDMRHASAIAKNYDPVACFGIGAVSLRADGHYYVIDAQHRVKAAQLAGNDSEVLFRVFRGLSTAEEAALFIALNKDKKNNNALDLFRLSVKAGSQLHCDVARVLESFGLQMVAYQVDGGVCAVVAVLNIYQGKVGIKALPGADAGLPPGHLLGRTLHILSGAWGKDRNAFDGVLLRGVAALLAKHGPQFDGVRLSTKLTKLGTAALVIGHIKTMQALAKKTSTLAAMEYLEGVYNSNRRTPRVVAQ